MSWSLVPFVLIVVLTACSGVFFQPGDWYETLRKPSWTPPNWAFGPVWTALYIMIAIAGWLVWSAQGFGIAMLFWCLQLVFNGLWSFFFFGRRRMDVAFVDALLMALSIVGFIVTAWTVSTPAALLFIPYLAWVLTAAALNRAVWRLNPAS